MKKYAFYFFVLVLTLTLSSCAQANEEAITIILDNLTVNEEIDSDITLPTEIDDYELTWTSTDESIVSNTGRVNRYNDDRTVTLTATIDKYSKTFEVTVLGYPEMNTVRDAMRGTEDVVFTFVGEVYSVLSSGFFVGSNSYIIYVESDTLPTIGNTVYVSGTKHFVDYKGYIDADIVEIYDSADVEINTVPTRGLSTYTSLYYKDPYSYGTQMTSEGVLIIEGESYYIDNSEVKIKISDQTPESIRTILASHLGKKMKFSGILSDYNHDDNMWILSIGQLDETQFKTLNSGEKLKYISTWINEQVPNRITDEFDNFPLTNPTFGGEIVWDFSLTEGFITDEFEISLPNVDKEVVVSFTVTIDDIVPQTEVKRMTILAGVWSVSMINREEIYDIAKINDGEVEGIDGWDAYGDYTLPSMYSVEGIVISREYQHAIIKDLESDEILMINQTSLQVMSQFHTGDYVRFESATLTTDNYRLVLTGGLLAEVIPATEHEYSTEAVYIDATYDDLANKAKDDLSLYSHLFKLEKLFYVETFGYYTGSQEYYTVAFKDIPKTFDTDIKSSKLVVRDVDLTDIEYIDGVHYKNLGLLYTSEAKNAYAIFKGYVRGTIAEYYLENEDNYLELTNTTFAESPELTAEEKQDVIEYIWTYQLNRTFSSSHVINVFTPESSLATAATVFNDIYNEFVNVSVEDYIVPDGWTTNGVVVEPYYFSGNYIIHTVRPPYGTDYLAVILHVTYNIVDEEGQIIKENIQYDITLYFGVNQNADYWTRDE